ncbi:MAG: DNA polymerase III subunit beta [Clostridiales bacterium]|nr:DNA polymerase III subunit beta [Clostridiales bacterium]MDD7035901.1 DNA polymerase III subunit beta [Bacillota bacterium]MDY2920516.1 DNA polymerase III subunit beta [Lentihominibacter sp.]
MKFTCQQQTLMKALNTVSKAVSAKTTIPTLKGILIETAGDSLVLTASDLDLSIRTRIEASVEEEGSAVVTAKLLSDIVRKLPNEELTLFDEGVNINIKTLSSEFKVICMPVEEFPEVYKKEDANDTLVFNRELFMDMVRKTAFAASMDESKGVLTGILTEVSPDSISMVAIDGFRLAYVREEARGERDKKFIVSARIMNDIRKIISDEDEECDVIVSFGAKKTTFSIGNTIVIIRLMEGEFLDYNNIIPKDSFTRAVIGREVLLESIERASLLAREGKNNLIRMSIVNNLLTITSRSDEGNVKEEIVIEKDGNDIEIGFNSKYVLDVLKAIDDEEVQFNFKSGVDPAIVTSVNGDEYKYLILPVRITSI